jgi:DNA adenine methylase
MTLPDYQQLAEILAKIKGKFILSINDHPDIRTVFKKFKTKPVSVAYTANNKNRIEGKELLIINF